MMEAVRRTTVPTQGNDACRDFSGFREDVCMEALLSGLAHVGSISRCRSCHPVMPTPRKAFIGELRGRSPPLYGSTCEVL